MISRGTVRSGLGAAAAAAAALAVAAPAQAAATQARPAPATRATAARAGAPPCSLPGGTARGPDVGPRRRGSPEDRGPGVHGANPTVDGLPRRVDVKSPSLSRNRRWYFGVRGGRLYYRPNVERTGRRGRWRHVPAPACLDGRIREISADDDELVAIDAGRWIYTMDNALGAPADFNWTSRWGIPLWRGPGFTVPARARAWSWSVISPREQRYWVDPAGNRHAVGDGKVSHVWSLDRSGRHFTLNDPWLPLDRSYEMCGPLRGRLHAVNISTSGSVIFAIDRFGDLYTRVYDFDISGLDNAFFRYSYADQRGRSDPAIQLPAAGWVRQPKIPGAITDRIGIHSIGRGTEHRILRVEGTDAAGHPGFWTKDSADLSGPGAWRFVRTPRAKLLGAPLANPPADASARALGRGDDARYVHAGGGRGGPRAEIPDFNIHCSPSTLRIHLPHGHLLDLALHVVDRIRGEPRAPGLDSHPRQASGTIEVTAAARRTARHDRAARAFIERRLGGRRFTAVDVFATTQTVRLRGLGMAFQRAGEPPGGACVTEPGFRRATVAPRGPGLRFTVRTRTDSPASVELRRVASARRPLRPRLVTSFMSTHPFSWRPERGRPANGFYVATLKTLTPGGRLDVRRLALARRRRGFQRLGAFTTRGRCELLRSFTLSGPVFGARRVLRIGVRTARPARAAVRVRRGGRTVSRMSLGVVRPGSGRRARIDAPGLRPGRYAIELTLRGRDGRVRRARLSAIRL